MKRTLVLAVVALCAWAQPQQTKPIVVAGKAVHAGSGTALKKAKVTLVPVWTDTPAATAETDDEGRYRLETDKSGRYRVRAEKTGYETALWGASKPNYSLGRPVSLAAGQEMTGMDIRLPKHGVIAGKVLNGENEPVGNALVLAWTALRQGTREVRIPRGSVPAMSNDLGEFRVSQLPPGRYRVCASPLASIQPSQAAPGTGPMKPEEIDATVCYPNAASLDQGIEVEIEDGTELPGIDLRLPRVRSVAIRGKVNGLPAGGSGVSVLALTQKGLGNAGMSYSRKTVVDASSGRFEFKGILPGHYVLHSLPTGLGAAAFLVKAPVEVADQPLDNLDVSAISPFEVKGTVIMPENPPAKLDNTRVVLTSEDEIMASVPNAQPGADGGFKLDSMLPGRYRIFVTPIPWQLHIASIRVGEREFTDGMIDIVSGASPLEIRLGASEASVFGPMTDSDGKPAPGGWALLVPQPRMAFRTRVARADQTGVYRLDAIAPGEYLLLAFDDLDPNRTEDEEYLKPHLSRAKRVKVEGASKQSLELRMPGR
jgi:protocatechuate 3,4-dioxygenase beta subunit